VYYVVLSISSDRWSL